MLALGEVVKIRALFSAIRVARAAGINVKTVRKGNCRVTQIKTPSGLLLKTVPHVTRLFFRMAEMEPTDVVEQSLLDQWDSFTPMVKKDLINLENHLKNRKFILGDKPYCSDFLIWAHISHLPQMLAKAGTNVKSWFARMEEHEIAIAANKDALEYLQKMNDAAEEKSPQMGYQWKLPKKVNKKQWLGKIVTRFPPEPSGCLHIGHCRALLINYQLATQCKGKMLVRFDDTNPSNEKQMFVDSILEDVKRLGMSWEKLSHTSDYFDLMLTICSEAMAKGDLYVERNPEDMKRQRDSFSASPDRERPIADNLKDWESMKKGTPESQGWIVRAKMDYKSKNGCLRDPACYRYKADAHVRTGDKFKVYPTYDFACPIVDAVEGVTHCARTNEYKDRTDQYKWMFKLLCEGRKYKGKDLKCPDILLYSRFEFVNTVLSKRKLGVLVNNRSVTGWDDPRMPTIQGILRRGLQLQTLLEYAGENAINTTESKHHWDKIWNLNKKKLDPIVPRYYAISREDRVKVVIKGLKKSGEWVKKVPCHPKHSKLTDKHKELVQAEVCYLERFDVEDLKLKAGNVVALMKHVIIIIDKINDNEGGIQEIVATAKIDATPQEWRDKSTPKLTWIPESKKLVPLTCVELDFLFKTASGDDDEEKMEFNDQSWLESSFLGEPAMATLKKGDCLQIVRRGFYVVDRVHSNASPMRLIFIPDGRTQEMSSLAKATNRVAVKTH